MTDGSTRDVPSCFVIGPIGDRLAPIGSPNRETYEQAMEVWEYVIEPACAQFDIRPVRADQIATPGEIPEQVFRHLREDDLVIADVTGGNANVMYELGLRHTVRRTTIQLGEVERLPFDINAIRTIRFQRTEMGLIEAREALRAAIKASLEREPDPVTATRIWHSSADEQPAVQSGHESQEDSTEAPGFVELLAEMEQAMPQVVTKLEELTNWGEDLLGIMNRSNEEIRRSDDAGAGAPGRLSVAIRLARDLEAPAARLERISQEFENLLLRIDPGVSYLIGRFEEEPSLLGEAADFQQGVAVAAQSMGDLASAMTTTEQGLSVLESVARQLRPPARRIRAALRRISEAADIIGAWDTRLRAVVP